LLWGSNARETHPIFFHHVLRGIKSHTKLYVIDPRRTATAQWATSHLSLHVGGDVALANAVAHTIVHEGLANHEFIARACVGYEAYRDSLDAYSPEKVQDKTGVAPSTVRAMARAYAKAPRAMICWTLGITEHQNAVDNVLALINLALLTGHVGRWGSGLNPLRGQNNVQGGGDMGALPHKLVGFQDVEDPVVRAKFDQAWGCTIPPQKGWHITEMFHAMQEQKLRALWVIGENPAQSEADAHKARRLLMGLDALIVQDVFMTKTAELADVVLPAGAGFCETEGTVTNSERRVQRVRKALQSPGEAKDDLWILAQLSKRLGRDWGEPTAEQLWDELRSLSPMHRGMSYARLESLGGIQWPCPADVHPGTEFLHGRLQQDPIEGRPAPFSVVQHSEPAEALSEEFPLRLTTGRRLSDYNTGVQSGGFASPIRPTETLDMHPFDIARYELSVGEEVQLRSARGVVRVCVSEDRGLKPGLVFLTLHRPEQVDTNLLTIDATDPRSGTAEFKAAAVRVEKLQYPHTLRPPAGPPVHNDSQ
jgi:formate dehydrogenase major subunit